MACIDQLEKLFGIQRDEDAEIRAHWTRVRDAIKERNERSANVGKEMWQGIFVKEAWALGRDLPDHMKADLNLAISTKNLKAWVTDFFSDQMRYEPLLRTHRRAHENREIRAQQKLAREKYAQEELAKRELANEEWAKKRLAKEKLAKEKLAKKELAKEKLAKEKLAKREKSQGGRYRVKTLVSALWNGFKRLM